MDDYVIVEVYNPGEDLLWSNALGFVSPESPEVSSFTAADVGNLMLPIGGRWMLRSEFDKCHEARMCLEGLPEPVCTENITIMDFMYILDMIDQLAITLYGHPINHDNDEQEDLWWSELENWAVGQLKAQYYSDKQDSDI